MIELYNYHLLTLVEITNSLLSSVKLFSVSLQKLFKNFGGNKLQDKNRINIKTKIINDFDLVNKSSSGRKHYYIFVLKI